MKPVTIIAVEDRPPITGGERYMYEIANHYRRRKRLLKVLRMKDFEPIKKTRIITINREICKYLSNTPQGSIILIDFYYHPWVIWAAHKLKKQKNCSIVVLTQWLDFDFIPNLLKREVQKIFAKLLLKISDATIANSSHFSRIMINFGANPKKQAIVSPGIEVDRFFGLKREERSSEGKLIKIIVINNLMKRKGIVDILYAAKLLNKTKEFEIHIFGDRNIYVDYVAKMMRLLKKLCLEERVYFRGSVLGDNLLAELEDADIFLQASHFEGYGISLVEAMLAGLPPVTTNTGIAEELIQDGLNGFLVPIKNPSAIAKALNILLNDNSIRREIGINARKTAIKQALRWEEVGTIFESAVDSFLVKK